MRLTTLATLLLAVLTAAGIACGPSRPSGKEAKPAMTMQLSSPSFADGASIPVQFTCQGADLSPALNWSAPPEGTASLALICDDPDAPAGTWVHWVVYNLPPTVRSLPEGVPKSQEVPGGGLQGLNDFRKVGWGGPCPPPGGPHRYFFRLYALKAPLPLPPGASRAQLDRAMQGQILGTGQLMGTYRRR